MLVGYARVSTAERNPDHQIDALLRAGVAPTGAKVTHQASRPSIVVGSTSPTGSPSSSRSATVRRRSRWVPDPGIPRCGRSPPWPSHCRREGPRPLVADQRWGAVRPRDPHPSTVPPHRHPLLRPVVPTRASRRPHPGEHRRQPVTGNGPARRVLRLGPTTDAADHPAQRPPTPACPVSASRQGLPRTPRLAACARPIGRGRLGAATHRLIEASVLKNTKSVSPLVRHSGSLGTPY